MDYFSSLPRPDQLWGPPSLLSNGYLGLLPWGQIGRVVKLTTHLQLVPRLRMCGDIPPLPHTPCVVPKKAQGQLYPFSFLMNILDLGIDGKIIL